MKDQSIAVLSDITKAKIRGSPCPICKKDRQYASRYNANKGKDKPCYSCANSIKGGGQGMAFNEAGEQLCNDCRLRPKKT